MEVDATQVVFQFASQEGATQFMERLRVPLYPFLALAGAYRPHDFEAWFQEMDPQSFGPGAFAVERSADFQGLLEQIGLKGHAQDDFHGWVRYGNLVSLLLVRAGVIDVSGVSGPVPEPEAIKALLATRSGPFYTLDQFQELLQATYQGLKEGATHPGPGPDGPPVRLTRRRAPAAGAAPPPRETVVRLTNHPARDGVRISRPPGNPPTARGSPSPSERRDGNEEMVRDDTPTAPASPASPATQTGIARPPGPPTALGSPSSAIAADPIGAAPSPTDTPKSTS